MHTKRPPFQLCSTVAVIACLAGACGSKYAPGAGGQPGGPVPYQPLDAVATDSVALDGAPLDSGRARSGDPQQGVEDGGGSRSGASDVGKPNTGNGDTGKSDAGAAVADSAAQDTSTSNPGGTDAGGPTNGGAGLKKCGAWKSTPTSWQLPDKMFDTMVWQWSPFTWTLLDLDGDLRPELVHTEDPNNKGKPFSAGGQSHWRVYSSTVGGFTKAAKSWSVPSKTYHAPFYQQSQFSWSLLDLTGDKRPDLVVTEDPKAQGKPFVDVVGPHWRVYANTGAGFSKSQQPWRVPSIDFETYAMTSGKWTWSTVDIDGDGWLDLVHTENPDDEGQSFVDTLGPHWRVYRGAKGGFQSKATRWPVPTADHDAMYAATGKWGWWTMDVNGDGRVDLIHTEDPNKPGHAFGGDASPHWRVYLNTGKGFAGAATTWKVPDAIFDSVSLQLQELSWSTIDINRDGWIDLVHTQDPINSGSAFVDVKGPHWRVYVGSSGGFSGAHTRWSVPRKDVDTLWSYGDWGSWGVQDLDGQGCLEWVDTRDPNAKGQAYGGASGPHWRVHWAP